MIIFNFIEYMMPEVFHRERIILLNNGSVRVRCGFEAKSDKKLFFIGEKDDDFMLDRILRMNKNNQQ